MYEEKVVTKQKFEYTLAPKAIDTVVTDIGKFGSSSSGGFCDVFKMADVERLSKKGYFNLL